MGSSHPAQTYGLIRPKNPGEWRKVSLEVDCEVWLNLLNGRKYMIYPLNSKQIDSEHNLQMYHFRKLNRLHLIAPESVLENHDAFCA